MELTDPRTVVTCSGANTALVGIAAAEKVANDGQTSIAVYTNGIFILDTAAGATANTWRPNCRVFTRQAKD